MTGQPEPAKRERGTEERWIKKGKRERERERENGGTPFLSAQESRSDHRECCTKSLQVGREIRCSRFRKDLLTSGWKTEYADLVILQREIKGNFKSRLSFYFKDDLLPAEGCRLRVHGRNIKLGWNDAGLSGEPRHPLLPQPPPSLRSSSSASMRLSCTWRAKISPMWTIMITNLSLILEAVHWISGVFKYQIQFLPTNKSIYLTADQSSLNSFFFF